MENLENHLRNILSEIIQEQTKSINKSTAIEKKFLEESSDTKWRDRLLHCLKENEQEVFNYGKSNLDALKVNHIKTLREVNVAAWSSDRKEFSVKIAEDFITFITNSVKSYVSSLLPPFVQQEIIVFTFECQKTYVLKEIMRDIAEKNFIESIKYILDPNSYAKGWLRNFTDKKIFRIKKAGEHFYAKIARKEIEIIFTKLEKSILEANKTTTTLSGWMKLFNTNLQLAKYLPISFKDLELYTSFRNVDMDTFKSIVNERIECMKRVSVQEVTSTNEKTVKWSEKSP